MKSRRQLLRTCGALTLILLIGPSRASGDSTQARTKQAGKSPSADDPADIAFFEKKIRPVLVQHCYRCHSGRAKKVKGGLRLDTRAATRAGGDSGAVIVPGKVEKSPLINALRHADLKMPPDRRLPEPIVRDFERWIQRGAADPRVVPADSVPKASAEFDLKQRAASHWCWRPLKRPVVPPGTHKPIDFFINRRITEARLPVASRASSETLIRRLKFDLLGLPPSVAELAALKEKTDEQAYAALVERWLESPQFGEKWASHWLDVIRFSETKGHVTDQERLFAWKYRDYVIDAFNDDLPYDRFVVEHLAGDLLPSGQRRPGRQGQRNISPTATGALYMHEMHFMAVDPVRQRWDEIDAQIDTVGKAFLGLTLGCSRCHDHKFDAISQRDYYALAGFFYSTEQSRRRTGPRAVLKGEHSIRVKKLETGYEKFLAGKVRARRRAQAPKAEGYFPISEELGIQSPNDFRVQLAKVKQLISADPSWSQWVRAAKDVAGRDVPLLVRGDHRRRGSVVPRRFLAAIPDDTREPPDWGSGSGRLWLAGKIASPDNPLTARVWVNRIWHHVFGRGIVATPNNFGKLGTPPSHPLLLDYLAGRLIESGWSTKTVLREILLSDVYRRSSDPTSASLERDPRNRWLSHQNRRRMTAELIRDNLLFVSGSLNTKMHGPSVQHFVPSYATANKPTNVPRSGPLDGDGRRSVYLKVRRNFYEPFLLLFDFPDRGKSVGRRASTTVPSQALAMLNGPFVHQQADRWGKRVARLPGTIPQRLATMFREATGRRPNPSERAALRRIVDDLKATYHRKPQPESRLWADLAHVLFNLNEFTVIE